MKTHGHRCGEKSSPTYASWRNMKARCLNSRHHRFKVYGARGIKVCAAWVESFPAFLRDMGTRPAGKTLDRIDVDAGYSPGNCRWATAKQQGGNQQRNGTHD